MLIQPKTLPLVLPLAGYHNVCFGNEKQFTDEGLIKRSIFIKFLGIEPQNPGEEIKVFTFGIFLLANAGRIRLGFIKRHQILIKA